MASKDIIHLLHKFTGNPPASDMMIKDFEHNSQLALPQDYIQFLKLMNGGEGCVGENAYLILWKIDEILNINQDYEVGKYAQNLILIGSDGGGEAFAFDTITAPWSVVQVPFIGMGRELIQILGSDFTSFLRFLYSE